jgi:hypothetical protein
MSIVESLSKLTDPVRAREREEERRKDREQAQRNDTGDPPPRFRCRVCGHEDADGAYCAECLSDTMVRLPRKP